MANLKEKYRLCEDISWRAADAEIVILNLESGDYFTLNETGAEIFLAVTDNKPLAQLLEKLRRKFGRPAEELEKDFIELLEDLMKNGIIEKTG
jgi:hypothetical protein